MAPTTSRMRAAREAAGLTREHVADKLHRSSESVRRWENGQNTPPRHCLLALARLYSRPVADLVD